MSTVLDSLNIALHNAMETDPSVIILGEDILDPYGGAFKVTKGLSTAFPGRVLTTPVSEAGIVGIATGMALRGLRPVVEIMFGDFLALAADQIINHAAKFRWMYNGEIDIPLVIRTPMGGRRGYGPTHSQSLEKFFLGAPGLRVLAPCAIGDPGDVLFHAILHGKDPTLFVENKSLYLLPAQSTLHLTDFELNLSSSTRPGDDPALAWAPPALSLTIRGAPSPVLTLVSYGHMAELARQASLKLAYEYEIFVELIVITQLVPFDIQPVLDSVSRTGRLLTAEEGSLTLGWGAEITARLAEKLGSRLKFVRRVAGRDLPIPASGPLEAAVLPGIEDILRAARELCGSPKNI